MDTVIKIYTEEKKNLPQLTNKYFQGATLYRATGIWEGIQEKATIIEIYGNGTNFDKAIELAEEINLINNQQATLVVSQNLIHGTGQIQLVVHKKKA